MNLREEHAHVRAFLQRLGSSYVYTTETVQEERVYQPVRIAPRRTVGARVLAPEPEAAVRPSALAFARLGPPAAPGGAATALAEPARPAVTAELDPAEELADALETRGHHVLRRDGRLFISNASQLTIEDRALIQQHKPRLIELATDWPEPSLVTFLNHERPRSSPWVAQDPPRISDIHEIVLNFETNGLDWHASDEPIGVTIGSLDGQLHQYLPFAHQGGGNLDRAAVIRYLQTEVRGKHILNSNTRFDVHMGRNIDVDFEAQDCTVSDIQHYAALLDDHRKKFSLDVLATDYLGGIEIAKLDERDMASYAAHEVATRAEYQVRMVADLHRVMEPQIREQELEKVLALESDVIYPLCEMERNGSPLDLPLVEQYHAECQKKHDELMWEIARECGFAFEHTPAGWPRLLESLGFRPPDSVAEDVLNQFDHPLVRKGQRASQYASLDSKTFAAYLKHIDSDGVLRYDINQLKGDEGGTVSGRFSIGLVHQVPNHDNHFEAFGEDLNPRRVFIPAVGDYLESDAMQIEFRLLAHFAQNKRILQAYQDDPLMSYHKLTWEMIKQYKADMLYSHLKNFNFAYQYGARLVKLAVMMGFITKAEGEEIRAAKRWTDPRLTQIREIEAAYDKMLPEGRQLLDRAAHLAKSSCDDFCRRGDALHKQYAHRGFVKTMLGRRSRFPHNYKTYIGLNRVLQGTGADILKRKTVELHKTRKWTGFVMRFTKHDAFMGDATLPETKDRVSEILNAQSFPELRVPVLWATGTGQCWAEAKG